MNFLGVGIWPLLPPSTGPVQWALKTLSELKKTRCLLWIQIEKLYVYIAWYEQVSTLHFQVYHQQNNMFALKQVSLVALLIASAYSAPQLDLEENARNINTAAYINVSKHLSWLKFYLASIKVNFCILNLNSNSLKVAMLLFAVCLKS